MIPSVLSQQSAPGGFTVRRMILVVLTLVVALAVTACGGGDSKPSEDVQTDSSSSTNTSESSDSGSSTEDSDSRSGGSGGSSTSNDTSEPTPSDSPSPSDSGGSSSAGSDPEPDPTDTPTPTPTPSPTPTPTVTPVPEVAVLFDGYDFELSEGDFWQFRWEYFDQSCAQGSGCGTTEDDGLFQVTLGESTVVDGVTMFRLVTTGDPQYVDGNVTHSFESEWSYMGIDGNRIVVSNSAAATLVTLFDAEVGLWAGSSFFSGRFADDVLVAASPGQLSGSDEFASWDGVRTGPWHSVSSADSGGECSLFDGRILCPTEEKFDYSQSEYFRPGVGPFGYRYNYSASFTGGGFASSFSTSEKVALVASSLSGDQPRALVEPTPVPPSPVPEPSPTPVVLGEPIFGPVSGSLTLAKNASQIPEFESEVTIMSGVADVLIENPNVTGKWSHAIAFRGAREEVFHAVFINSDGEWGHFARGGSLASQITIALGNFEFDRTPGGTNRLTVWFGVLAGEDTGVFQINDQDVAVLDLSFSGASEPGDVSVMSGLFPADEFEGGVTNYTDFTVYAKP